MENTQEQVAKTNNSGEGVTETQQQMVGRLVMKITQVKLPMDLLHIEDRIDEVIRAEAKEEIGEPLVEKEWITFSEEDD